MCLSDGGSKRKDSKLAVSYHSSSPLRQAPPPPKDLIPIFTDFKVLLSTFVRFTVHKVQKCPGKSREVEHLVLCASGTVDIWCQNFQLRLEDCSLTVPK